MAAGQRLAYSKASITGISDMISEDKRTLASVGIVVLFGVAIMISLIVLSIIVA